MRGPNFPRSFSLGVKHGEAIDGSGAVFLAVAEEQRLLWVVDQVDQCVLRGDGIVGEVRSLVDVGGHAHGGGVDY